MSNLGEQAVTSYTVGYGRPPVEKQFKPGQSGNPRGRPKGSRQLFSIVREVMNRRLTIVEDGERKTIPMNEAVVRTIFTKAIKGDPRASVTALKLINLVEQNENERANLAIDLSDLSMTQLLGLKETLARMGSQQHHS